MASAALLALAVSGQTETQAESPKRALPLPQIIAHRGGSREQDENTLQGMKNSYEKGVRGFETDVRLTKDRRVVVLHDDTLDRTTNGKGKVEAMTAAEISLARTKKSGQPVPFLEELFSFLADKEGVALQVEIKCGKYSEADLDTLCRIMTEMVKKQIEPSKVVFICFEPRALKKIKELNPQQQTCLVSSEVTPGLIKAALEVHAEFLSVQLNNLYRAFVKDAHKAGLKVTTWTPKSEEDAQLAILLGTDYVTTDIPAAQLEQHTARP
jgi:glycerophosphoryl diester phosphodiesterase